MSLRLSYGITEKALHYPGNPMPLRISHNSQILRGDVCNTSTLTIFNHSGTHIDAPRHFNSEGLSISDLNINIFVYKKPKLVDVPKNDCDSIVEQNFEGYYIAECDILLIRTGFGKLRKCSTQRYTRKNPSPSPKAARYLVDKAKSLKAIALDAISVGTYERKQEGIETHKTLTGINKRKGFILIIERSFCPLFVQNLRYLYCGNEAKT